MSTVGSTTELPTEKVTYLINFSVPHTNFYGFFGYEDTDGKLEGLGTLSITRKHFNDNLLFLDDTEAQMEDAKARLVVIKARVNEAYV